VYELWAGELRSALTARAVPAAAQTAMGKAAADRVVHGYRNRAPQYLAPIRRRAGDAMLTGTLRVALEKLVAAQGPDMTKWSWGALHHVTFLIHWTSHRESPRYSIAGRYHDPETATSCKRPVLTTVARSGVGSQLPRNF